MRMMVDSRLENPMNPEINKKCVVLARVSSRAQEEEGYSLDSQEKFLKEYCKNKGLVNTKLFKITETASKPKQRKTFAEMMIYINTNRIKILVVEKADRLTRSFKDMVMIDDWLEADDKRHVHLVKDGLIMNKHSSSQNKLNWGVKVLFAKNYTDNLREEVRKGRKEKLAQGWLPGSPPYGWTTVGEKGRKEHTPILEQIRLVKKLMEKYLEPGQSLTSVTAYSKKIGMRNSYGNPYGRSAITDNILKNPFYIGINRWEGIDYPGKQQKVISKELYDKVQAKMHRKSPPKNQKHNPDFSNLMVCPDCNGFITWEPQKGNWYGHCVKSRGCPKKVWARQDRVEEQLFKHFEKLLCPSPEIAEWIIESLKAKHQDNMYDYSTSVELLRADHDRKIRQADLLYQDRLSERITPERYDELYKQIAQEQEDIEDNIKNLADTGRSQLKTGIDVLEKSQQAVKVYATKSPEAKRKLLSELFDVLYLDGPTLNVTYNRYTEAISERVKRHGQVERQFRTDKKAPNNGGDSELIEALHTVWRARPDSNR